MSIARSSQRPSRLVIATRESALAMWQAHYVQAHFAARHKDIETTLLGMTTAGDRMPGSSLAALGGKGLFIKELEEAIAAGRADLAVHSMKDVPADLAPGFTVAAILERADPRDAYVSERYRSLAELPAGSRVGTSSLRREAQLRARFPELRVEPLRGNVPTRLRKLDEGQYEAIIVAAAGLKRLGLAGRITALLAPEESLPAVGQGALGLECASERGDLLGLLSELNHAPTAACVMAERAFSRALAGNCNVPLGGFAELNGARLRLRGFVGAPDGSRSVSGALEGPATDPVTLGQALAEQLKAQGAARILAALEAATPPKR